MSEKMQIKAQEHGLVRVFAIDLPADDMATFAQRTETAWPFLESLGATQLDDKYVEVFDVADLEDLGLAGYMLQGLGVAADDIAGMRQQLDALRGPVAIVLSKAFQGQAQSLSPKAPMRWIGTFREDAAKVQFEPLKSESAQGTLAAAAPPEHSSPHLTLLAALLALPLLLGVFALVVWLVMR